MKRFPLRDESTSIETHPEHKNTVTILCGTKRTNRQHLDMRRPVALILVTLVLATAYGELSALAATRFVDDDAPNDPGSGNTLVSDPLEDGTNEHPFDSIQEGIDAATSGVDEVVVLAGSYRGPGNVNVDFLGKAITVRSLDGPDVTIVDCENQPETRGFVFETGYHRGSVLRGFTKPGGTMQGATP